VAGDHGIAAACSSAQISPPTVRARSSADGAPACRLAPPCSSAPGRQFDTELLDVVQRRPAVALLHPREQLVVSQDACGIGSSVAFAFMEEIDSLAGYDERIFTAWRLLFEAAKMSAVEPSS